MLCFYYQNKKCLSCQWIDTPYSNQIEKKQKLLSQTLNSFKPIEIMPPFASPKLAFRNKAKMAVLGTVEKPILGIQTGDESVDLCDCPLYSKNMQKVLKIIRTYIRKQALVPYNIDKRSGELKFIILTESAEGLMLRFVLKTDKLIKKIQISLADLQKKIKNLHVISANIQPKHAAILEGDKEFILTQNQYLSITLNQVPLFVKSKSFFQTNTEVAAHLYKTASDWISNLPVNFIWDLFCGVGGFGLHCVSLSKKTPIKLTGIEIDPDAIDCAIKSAKQLDFKQLTFSSLDATNYALAEQNIPDVVLLNPPRRGAGKVLMDYLQRVGPNYILYSSCNLESLAEDLAILFNYQIARVQLFDMFPHTTHMEVLALLIKKHDKDDIIN